MQRQGLQETTLPKETLRIDQRLENVQKLENVQQQI